MPVEVANALRKHGLQAEVADEIHALCSLRMDIYSVDVADVRDAAELYKQTGVSPYDCLHAAVMRKHDLKEIISADRDFHKFTWLTLLDPTTISRAIR